MKRILLATLSMTLLSAPAFSETIIAVSCQCSFIAKNKYETYIATILAYGERTDATRFDVENCVLEDGKVAPGTCWSAKGPALINCEEEAKRNYPDPLYIPEVSFNEDTCYGLVENQ